MPGGESLQMETSTPCFVPKSVAAAAAWGGGGGVPVEEVEKNLEETQEKARGMEGARRRLGIGRELEEVS